jgi:hypothetical protein
LIEKDGWCLRLKKAIKGKLKIVDVEKESFHLNEIAYDSGESEMGDHSAFRREFSSFDEIIDEKVKKQFILGLWTDAYRKLRGATEVINTFGDVAIKMNTFGSTRKTADLERLESRKPLFFVIVHDHWLAKAWMYSMHLLLIYTAFNIPLNVAFDQSDNEFMSNLDKFIDYMFIADLFINFITGYEDDDKNSEFRLKLIAVRYLKSWFFIDFMACLPFDKIFEGIQLEKIIQQSSISNGPSREDTANKLLRLAKLPRLYRLIRIVRLLRLLKMGNSFKRIFEIMNVNLGVSKLVGVIVIVIFLTHLYACLWFWIADFFQEPGSEVLFWVKRKGYEDLTSAQMYVNSVYWSFQTLTTVGYGDISAKTSEERIVALIWIILGCGFYSFTIGNLQLILNEVDMRSHMRNVKLETLEDYAKRTHLPFEIVQEITNYLQNNSFNENALGNAK